MLGTLVNVGRGDASVKYRCTAGSPRASWGWFYDAGACQNGSLACYCCSQKAVALLKELSLCAQLIRTFITGTLTQDPGTSC